jgi:hypothetical protein
MLREIRSCWDSVPSPAARADTHRRAMVGRSFVAGWLIHIWWPGGSGIEHEVGDEGGRELVARDPPGDQAAMTLAQMAAHATE